MLLIAHLKIKVTAIASVSTTINSLPNGNESQQLRAWRHKEINYLGPVKVFYPYIQLRFYEHVTLKNNPVNAWLCSLLNC